MTLTKTLEEKLAQMWPDPRARRHAVSILDQYGCESSEREETRVRLAILKLCSGNADALPELVEAAKRDYRDVLLWAEYPGQAKAGPTSPKPSRAESTAHEKRRKSDRLQYETWLKD